MSLNVDDDDHKPTAHFPSIPLDLNGNEITWDQNFANALGRISRLMDAFERDGTFDAPPHHERGRRRRGRQDPRLPRLRELSGRAALPHAAST